MPDSKTNERKNGLLAQVRELSDSFSVWKIDRLTDFARQVLPDGYWGSVLPDHQGQRFACLTFDDGPDPHTTPALLEMLEQHNIKATFFLIGAHAARHPDLVEAISRGGHSIGSHSYTHQLLPFLSTARLETEIDQTNERVAEVTGQAPVFFRPPYGIMEKRTAAILSERSMQAVYWGAVPEDWMGPGAERVISRVMKRLGHGNLVVLHERKRIAPQTLNAVKEIISRAKERGIGLVGIPELMALS